MPRASHRSGRTKAQQGKRVFLLLLRVSGRDRLLTAGGLPWRDGRAVRDGGEMPGFPDALSPHVSVENQFPEDLYDAMLMFISSHPDMDQYRLMQAAVAGFLFQQGCKQPAVVQHYLAGIFRHQQAERFTSDPA